MAGLKKKKEWYVYMVACKDGKIYTGVTNDFERRIKQHNRGRGCKFTKIRFPVTPVYKKSYPSKSAALKREAEIKKWDRERKLALVI